MRPADTSPEAWQVYLRAQRRMTPGERIQLAIQYSISIDQVSKVGLRHRYPKACDREIFLRAAKARLGSQLFSKAFGEQAIE